jgi:hypothetical protein
MRDSGHIRLDGDVIRYRSSAYGNWDLAVSDVRMVGERTNQSGPFADDYFFCFATGPGMWQEASFYAEGRDEFLDALGAKLGAPLFVGLCHSADFASRILWPPSLAGQAMFDHVPVPRRGVLGSWIGPSQILTVYTPRVAAVLAGIN